MATFTEIIAAMVVQSSAVAYSHFGLTLEPVKAERPAAVERTVARSIQRPTEKVLNCTPQQRAGVLKT
jgi:hypothetical protein